MPENVDAAPLRVGLLDPSLGTLNTGDEIIREGVLSGLSRVPRPVEVTTLPTRRPHDPAEVAAADACDVLVVGGTNLLSSNMPFYRQWDVGFVESRHMFGRVVLMGVGWWMYQKRPNLYTRALLRRLLSDRTDQSVRDDYTRQKLAGAGVRSRNTCCPTTWALAARPERRTSPSSAAVVTITDYSRKPEADQRWLEAVSRLYDDVVLWPQGSEDIGYVRELGIEVDVLAPTLAGFDDVLAGGDVDYVGTRLHGGIRALQHGCRSTIVAIDSRAREISRDTDLPTVRRESTVEEIYGVICAERVVELRIPHGEIEGWLESLASARR